MNTPRFTALIALLATGMTAAPASAQPLAGERLLAHGVTEVADSILADMRGRFVPSSDKVLFFGVQMQSSWQTPDGHMLNGGATFSIDFSSAAPDVSFHPTVSITETEQVGELVDTGNRSITGEGTRNVSGLSQSLQIAGDHNRVDNVTRLKLLDKIPDLQLPENGEPAATAQKVTNGMTATATLDGTGALVQLEVEGQGLVEQALRAHADGALGQVRQHAQVLGDYHRIANQLDLAVVLRNESQVDALRQGLGGSIASLKGLVPSL